MLNARKIGGGYCICSTSPHYMERGNGSLISVPSERPTLMRGGLRWNDTSEIGGVIYG